MNANSPTSSAEIQQPLLGDFQRKSWAVVIGITLVLCFVYWNTLWGLAQAWNQPTYNHSYLIPVFAVFLLSFRREPFTVPTPTERWIGVGTIVLATMIRIAGSNVQFLTIDRGSMLLCLLGVFVFVGGFRALRWAGPPILFLVFMFPWPRFFADRIMHPMQTFATIISTYALQTMGVDAFREGNRIILEHQPLNVAEQCSGLRMLTIFIALSVAMAMISTNRPLWERVMIVVSSPIIALAVNAIRITLTGLLLSLDIGGEALHRFFHDFAGLIMMPMALGLLFLEMNILSRVIIEDERTPTLNTGFGQPVT